MKVLLLGFSKIKYMPYVNFYLDNIDRSSNEVHLLYWNRNLQEEDLSSYKNIHLHEFKEYQEDQVSKIKKIKGFLKYRKLALKILKSVQPDLIIVLHTFPGILLSDKLKKNYAGEFIFDYRDSTYEHFRPFKKKVHDLVRSSKSTFVSSDAFRALLPTQCGDKIYTSHNIVLEDLKHREKDKKHYNKIRIAFWGFIRNEEINREIIKKIAKDERFELHYYGREQETAINLKKYAEEIQAKNIFFHGEYKPQDRYEFVKNADIIHNIYCDNNMQMAISNKYYDGLIFYLPQICMKGSFMGESVQRNGIGWQMNPYDDDFTEKIYVNYIKIDFYKFYQSCDNYLASIIEQYKAGGKMIQAAEL